MFRRRRERSTLMETAWIVRAAQARLGRPLTYGTTETFLAFPPDAIKDLPASPTQGRRAAGCQSAAQLHDAGADRCRRLDAG